MEDLLLKLLVLSRPMDTAAAWKEALEGSTDNQRNAQPKQEGVQAQQQEEEAATRGNDLMRAIDAVVPLLPNYKTLHTQLEALMEYCRNAYPVEIDLLVQMWLRRGSTSTTFRTWVVDWLGYSHLVRIKALKDENALWLWNFALSLASLHEEQISLKRRLLGYVDELNTIAPSDSSSSEHVIDILEHIDTVEKLLDFYWHYAEELAPFAMLCAAKLHVLVFKQASRGLQLSDTDIMVRLKWSLALKPWLFQTLLEYAILLKVFHGVTSVIPFQLSAPLNRAWSNWAHHTIQGDILKQLTDIQNQLEDAYKANAVHVVIHTNEKSQNCLDGGDNRHLSVLSCDEADLVLKELERDLEDVPTHLFPNVIMVFGVVLSTISSSQQPEMTDSLMMGVELLFTTLCQRSDHTACFIALALILKDNWVHHHIWREQPHQYLAIVEALHNSSVLYHHDAQKRWILNMTVQLLLFECDVGLVEACQGSLSVFLPTRLLHLISIRCSSFDNNTPQIVP